MADIDYGTTEIEKIPGVNELFKLAHSKDISLVHLCDLSWNQIVPSLQLIQSKLIDLGFEYYEGDIGINETEAEKSQCHTQSFVMPRQGTAFNDQKTLAASLDRNLSTCQYEPIISSGSRCGNKSVSSHTHI